MDRKERRESERDMRRVRNCDRENPGVFLGLPFAPELNRCPWSIINEQSLAVLQWWSEWKRFGVLPYGGATIDDEPEFVWEALTLCEDTLAEIERERCQTKPEK